MFTSIIISQQKKLRIFLDIEVLDNPEDTRDYI